MVYKIKAIFSYSVVALLLGFSAWFHSAAFAYSAILGLGMILAYNAFETVEANKTYKQQIPEEVKRTMQDLNARVLTIEHGIRARGF